MTVFVSGPALLFCPADRPERYVKAAERADSVIIDLEDAVAPAAREAARAALTDPANTHLLDPAHVIVRVNPIGTSAHERDLEAVARTPFRTLMVAKAEKAEAIADLPAGYNVIALCETARGIVNVERIAALDRVVAVMWGAEDLVASLEGSSSRRQDGSYRDIARYARSRTLMACGAYDTFAIDAVHLDISDLQGLRLEAEDAAASGFNATACIHPSQVDAVRSAYRPTDTEISAAHAVLAAAEGQRGVFRFEDRMIDEPMLRHARAVLRRA